MLLQQQPPVHCPAAIVRRSQAHEMDELNYNCFQEQLDVTFKVAFVREKAI